MPSHKQTLWAHTLELSSTLHFTLISAEGPVPEWVRPVVSVCQNRWTLDPLSAFPAKQMTCLLLSQPSFRLYIFYHPRAAAHRLAALPQRQKHIKRVFVGMDGCFCLGTSIFASATSEPEPTRLVFVSLEFKLSCKASWSSSVTRTTSTGTTALTNYLQLPQLKSSGHLLTSL